jgi:hypothetical protein
MCLQVPRKKLEIESLPTGEEQGLCVGASFKIAVSTFHNCCNIVALSAGIQLILNPLYLS